MGEKCTTKRKRRSLVWKLPEKDFRKLVLKAKRLKDITDFFGIRNEGGNFRTVKSRITFLGIDTSHFLGRLASSHLNRKVSEEIFRKEWLVENSDRSRGAVKKHLQRFKLLSWECSGCGNEGTWCGKKLSLQLEHRNGVHNDNRLENLCFLCPNCHSQTDTFAGKSCRARTRT